MNEVNILNIGGIDYNIDDQLARDVIAHSENGLDPQSNLPISSRHYDEGDYLIGQDRLYYEVTSDIEIGDVIAEGVNVRATIISEELVRLKNQSSIEVIQSIAKVESTTLSSRNYIIGQYFYWDFGLAAGLYETIATITSGDAFSVDVNIKLANKIADTMDGLQDAYNITGAKNLCPNNASDTVTTDITWDVLSDGSIQVSGTPASTRTLVICEDGVVLPAGTYTLTTGTDRVCLQAKNKANGTVLGRSNGYEYPETFTISAATTVTFLVYTIGGTSSMNVRAFPMCRVASITDDAYVPYAMTNKQLTDCVYKVIATANTGTSGGNIASLTSIFNTLPEMYKKRAAIIINGYILRVSKYDGTPVFGTASMYFEAGHAIRCMIVSASDSTYFSCIWGNGSVATIADHSSVNVGPAQLVII